MSSLTLRLVPLVSATSFLFGLVCLSTLAGIFNATFSCEAFIIRQSSTGTRKIAPHSIPTGLFYSRQICSFDVGDFALPTGEWPYTAADMNRIDNTDDEAFYSEPRLVTHIDDYAIESLTAYYREELTAISRRKIDGGSKDGTVDVLDMCSSWISHLPESGNVPLGRVVGIGMNEKELEANKALTEYYVQNLNLKPSLDQFRDDSFDAVCNVVSVDYLTRPQDIFKETHRVLRPGGCALISFSNRCFPTKAVAMWLQADDIDRLTIVGSYFHYSAPWASIEALDIKQPAKEAPERPSLGEMFNNPSKGIAWMNTASAVQKVKASDPMFVVKGVK